MTSRTTRMQVERVLAGLTVTGRPYGTPVSFSRDPERRSQLLIYAGEFFCGSARRLSIPERTAYVRKLASFLTRCTAEQARTICMGTLWFRQHPELATTKMSFGGAIRAYALDQQRQRNRAAEQDLHGVNQAARCIPYETKPIIYVHDNHAVEELTHPAHLLAVGEETGNCLALSRGTTRGPNPQYWRAIAQGHLRLFTVRDDVEVVLIFAIAHNDVTEFQIVRKTAELPVVFAGAVATLARSMGHIHYEYRALFHAYTNHGWGQPSQNPIALVMPYARELKRALRGDIPGQPTLPSLTLPRPPSLKRLLSGCKIFIESASAHTPAERMLFARKLTLHVVADHPSSISILDGAYWFGRHRGALATDLSFEAAAALELQARQRVIAYRSEANFESVKDDLNIPFHPMAVLLEGDGFRLTLLDHPHHLIIVGRTLKNCLAKEWKGIAYPNTRYWSEIKAGGRHLFAIWRGESILVLFTVVNRTITEMTRRLPRTQLEPLLRACAPAVETLTGPIQELGGVFWPDAHERFAQMFLPDPASSPMPQSPGGHQ